MSPRPQSGQPFPRWRVGLLTLTAAAVLAVFAGQRATQAQQRVVDVKVAVAAPQQAWTDEQFEQWVFQQDRTAAGARRRYDSLLALHVEDIDRACQLSDAQTKKLQLLGRGDIKRVFDGYEKAKHQFNLLHNDVQQIQQVMPLVRPFQMAAQADLFQDDSLLAKSLRHTLTDEQFARYEAAARERRAFRHRAQIELAVNLFEQAVPLRDEQRRALVTLLTSETKPPRRSGQYDYYVFMYQFGRIPEGKIKPLLSDTQWKVLDRLLAQYKAIVPNLRQNGLLPDDDGDADAPAAPKK